MSGLAEELPHLGARRAFLIPLGLAIAVAGSSGAAAQSSPAAAAATDADDTQDILVTARRRSESLQSVPEAITAFSARKIEDAHIEKFSDFAAMTPNFEFFPSASPGNFQMSIRGISQAGGAGGDAPVVMVVDGVTLPYPNSFTFPLVDIESIQVLKGPQGALYGQNAIGGAVVITTQQPTNEFHGRVTGSYGKGNEYKLTGVLSGPIVKDKLLFRVSALRHSFEGDVRYAYAPREYSNYLRDNFVKADLKYLLSDNFTADLSVDYGTTFSGGQPLSPTTFSQGSGIPGVTTDALNSQLVLNRPNADYHTRTRRRSLDGSLRLRWKTDFAELSSVTAGTVLHENNRQDLDVSHIPFVRLVDQPVHIRAFSQELRLNSPSDQKLRWTVIGFMSKVHRSIPDAIDGNLTLLTGGGANPADALYVPLASSDADQRLNSYAGSVQLNYDILPTLELTVAGRYDHDPRSQVSSGVRLARTFNRFQPKASISFKPTTRQTYYFTYAEGFRPGGFNPGVSAAVQPAFDPEKTSTFEIGSKFRFLDGKLTLALAAYTTKYVNQQLTLVQVTATSANQSIFTVKSDRIKGIELEATAQPVPGLELSFGGGLQDGKIKEFGTSLSGAAFDPASYEGNKVPLQSKYTMNAAAQYTHVISGDVEAFARGDLIRKGRLYWYADNKVSRAPFNLVNLKVGLRNGRWELNAYGSNIFNKRYNSLYFDNTFVGAPGGFDFAGLASLSRYGVELSFRF